MQFRSSFNTCEIKYVQPFVQIFLRSLVGDLLCKFQQKKSSRVSCIKSVKQNWHNALKVHLLLQGYVTTLSIYLYISWLKIQQNKTNEMTN